MPKPSYLRATSTRSDHAAYEKERRALALKEQNTASVRVEQATRRFQDGLIDKGLACLELALAHVNKSRDPEYIYGKAISLYMKHGFPEKAKAALTTARERFPKNIALITQQGKLHMIGGNPAAAVQLLTPHYQKHREDYILGTVLADAHLQNGNAPEAIRILKPIKKVRPDDSAVQKILANAYIETNQRSEFHDTVRKIKDQSAKDYLTAKFHFLDNETSKAMTILRPYATGERNSSRNIRYLFLACVGPELVENHEREEYKRWHDNPLRAEMRNDFMASSKTMYEEGANPVSSSAKKAASLAREARVHIREPGPKND